MWTAIADYCFVPTLSSSHSWRLPTAPLSLFIPVVFSSHTHTKSVPIFTSQVPVLSWTILNLVIFGWFCLLGFEQKSRNERRGSSLSQFHSPHCASAVSLWVFVAYLLINFWVSSSFCMIYWFSYLGLWLKLHKLSSLCCSEGFGKWVFVLVDLHCRNLGFGCELG